MKKLFLVLAVASISLVACKKDYACTTNGVTVTFSDIDNDEADVAEQACTDGGGTWSDK